MHHIPEHLSPRDALTLSLAKLNGHLMYAQTEASRIGQPGLEDDLHQIWQELIRVEKDFASMRYPKRTAQIPGQLRLVPGE